MAVQKKIVIIAGPNGAGKTTFAREFLPFEADCPLFVNADLIAGGLSPFSPNAAALRAGRLMLTEIDRHAAAGHNFAFETTLAGHTYARRIPRWRAAGFTVKLMFLSLASVDEAIAPCGNARATGWTRRAVRSNSKTFRQRHEKLPRNLPPARRLLAMVR